MACERCGGLLREVRANEGDATVWLTACVNCGDRTDSTIWYHRTLSAAPDPGPPVILPVYDPDRWGKFWKRRVAQ